MRPALQNSEKGVGARPTENGQIRAAGGPKVPLDLSPATIKSPGSRSESRFNDRFARLLNQKKGPDAVITGVLAVALLFGLGSLCTSCGLWPLSSWPWGLASPSPTADETALTS
jgi:hypothetical protein